MRQYCPARAEEDEQGNVHVDESEDVMKEYEEDLDKIMSEVNKRSIDYILPRVTFLRLRVQHHHCPESPPTLIINFVIIIA